MCIYINSAYKMYIKELYEMYIKHLHILIDIYYKNIGRIILLSCKPIMPSM